MSIDIYTCPFHNLSIESGVATEGTWCPGCYNKGESQENTWVYRVYSDYLYFRYLDQFSDEVIYIYFIYDDEVTSNNFYKTEIEYFPPKPSIDITYFEYEDTIDNILSNIKNNTLYKCMLDKIKIATVL